MCTLRTAQADMAQHHEEYSAHLDAHGTLAGNFHVLETQFADLTLENAKVRPCATSHALPSLCLLALVPRAPWGVHGCARVCVRARVFQVHARVSTLESELARATQQVSCLVRAHAVCTARARARDAMPS